MSEVIQDVSHWRGCNEFLATDLKICISTGSNLSIIPGGKLSNPVPGQILTVTVVYVDQHVDYDGGHPL